MYEVIHAFNDPEHGCVYNVGDAYPATGKKAAKKRIAYLAGTENKIGAALIVPTEGHAEPSDDE